MDILCRRRNVINYSYLGKSYYEVSVSPVIYWDKHLVNILARIGNIFQREVIEHGSVHCPRAGEK